MDEPTEALLKVAVVGCIKDAGVQLQKWVSVLDEIAATHTTLTDVERRQLPPHARVITDTTLELALAVASAYAKAFNQFVEYGVAAGLSSVSPELNKVAKYKALIENPRALFDAMCLEYEAQQHGEAH